MYRMTRHTPLSTGQKYGDIVMDGDLQPDTINRMLQSGTLTRISTPPLSELPGWEERAGVLANQGVIFVIDLIKANKADLGKKLRKAPRTISLWQDEALEHLKLPTSNDND